MNRGHIMADILPKRLKVAFAGVVLCGGVIGYNVDDILEPASPVSAPGTQSLFDTPEGRAEMEKLLRIIDQISREHVDADTVTDPGQNGVLDLI